MCLRDFAGIEKLRDFLQKLLDQHIENELPKVREEIKSMIHSTERDIIRLPTERPTTGHLRMYLSELAMQFHNLSMAALNGDYHTGNSDFFEVKDEKASVRSREEIKLVGTLHSTPHLRGVFLFETCPPPANLFRSFRPRVPDFERTSIG